MKIIGLEFRVRNYSVGGETVEVALFPLNIELPPGNYWEFPCTLHTDQGDLGMALENRVALDSRQGCIPGTLASFINHQVGR